MSDIILSQCRSVSSLRSGEFKVSQAVILQCGGDGQSTQNTPHVFLRGATYCAVLVITNLHVGRAAGGVIIDVTEKPRLWYCELWF